MTSVFLFCFILFLAALGLHCYACGLSLVAVSGGYSSLRCVGFSCCRTRALDARASVLVARGLSSCGVQPGLLCGMWDLPGPGIEPASPALAGRFLTTAPPGKSLPSVLMMLCLCSCLKTTNSSFKVKGIQLWHFVKLVLPT